MSVAAESKVVFLYRDGLDQNFFWSHQLRRKILRARGVPLELRSNVITITVLNSAALRNFYARGDEVKTDTTHTR